MPRQPTLMHLRREIERYIKAQPHNGAGPLAMPDLLKRAVQAQKRIERLGYRWDSQRELWRGPQVKR